MPAKEQPELDEFLDQIAQLFAKDTVEAIARETKFVQRESKLTGQIFLITCLPHKYNVAKCSNSESLSK